MSVSPRNPDTELKPRNSGCHDFSKSRLDKLDVEIPLFFDTSHKRVDEIDIYSKHVEI